MRPRGWIQDSGSLDNLIKIVEIFDNSSTSFQELKNKEIDNKIHNAELRNNLKTTLGNHLG